MPRIDTAKHPENSPANGAAARAGKESKRDRRTHSFSVDRKGESSAGALSEKDKKRSVEVSSDGSNTR